MAFQIKDIGTNVKKYYTQNKWVQYAVKACLIIGILILVMPFVCAEGYTYLCEDDYSFEGGARDGAEKYGQLKGAFHKANRYYKEAQGTYFANFVWHFVRPYIRWGMPGFHAIMIACMVVFILSFFYLIRKICKDETYGLCIMLLTFLAIWGMSDSYNMVELVFWYTGTVNFTWVLSFSILTLLIQLKIRDEEDARKRWLFTGVSVITALIGSGGALLITATQCSWLLIVLLLNCDKIKEKKLIVVPFLMAFIGALWNTLAPGNFVRVEAIGVDYTVWNAMTDTWIHWKNYVVEILNYPLFIIILSITFMITFVSGVQVVSKGINHLKMLIIIVGVFATQYLTAFPAVLGYLGEGLHNMRTAATYELIAKITFIFLVMCMAQWSRENIKISNKLLPVFVILIVIFGALNVKEVKMCVKEGYAYNVAKELLNGTIRDNYKVREAILAQLDSASDWEDVYILANPIPDQRTMYGMGLLDDPEAFVNMSAAGLFRLDSVTVVYKEE